MHFSTEDFEVFDFRDTLNVIAYMMMSFGKTIFEHEFQAYEEF